MLAATSAFAQAQQAVSVIGQIQGVDGNLLVVKTPAGEQKVLVGELAKTAIRYVFKPRLGTWLKLFTTLLGRMPPDSHAWIVTDVVPTFVRFEGPLYTRGPIWRIEVTSPRWPAQPDTEPRQLPHLPAPPHAAP